MKRNQIIMWFIYSIYIKDAKIIKQRNYICINNGHVHGYKSSDWENA